MKATARSTFRDLPRLPCSGGTFACLMFLSNVSGTGLSCGGHLLMRPLLQAGQMDRKSEESACNSKRSHVASYPTQEKEGLLWVWAESGPTSFIEAAATPAKSNESYASWPGESGFSPSFSQVCLHGHLCCTPAFQPYLWHVFWFWNDNKKLF